MKLQNCPMAGKITQSDRLRVAKKALHFRLPKFGWPFTTGMVHLTGKSSPVDQTHLLAAITKNPYDQDIEVVNGVITAFSMKIAQNYVAIASKATQNTAF
jgi:hypothetical protein